MRNSSPKPSISFSITSAKASGVMSRPVMPVPPVVMTQSICGSAMCPRSTATILSLSSVTMARLATLWPSRVIISASRSPDLSSAAVRVSEMVRTAMLTGRKGSVSSIRAMERDLGAGSVQGFVARPVSGCKLIERGHRLAQPVAVDPQVGQHPFDEEARLLRRQRFDEQQRVVGRLRGALPLAEVARPAVVGGGEAEQVALHALVRQQVGDIALAQFQVEAGVVQLVLAFAAVAAVAGHVAGGARHQLHQPAGAVGAHR